MVNIFKTNIPDLSAYPSKSKNIKEKYQDFKNSGVLSRVSNYLTSLFPILSWIGSYNPIWLTSDVIAGLTVASVVIPQAMGYADLVGLDPEYGLYSSFVGVTIYFLFSTSKDVTIGPTAAVSLTLAQSIASIQAAYGDAAHNIPTITIALAFTSGAVALLIGILRLGFIVNLISGPVVAGFTTGTVITITFSQAYKVLGITGVTSTDPAYLMLVDTLKNLSTVKIDAALGMAALIYLYGLKYGAGYLGKRYPSKARFFFFVEILRNISVIILGALVTYLAGLGKSKNPFKILKDMPRGFQHMGVPDLDGSVLSQIASALPITVLVLILEHVAIAKNFGRINNYKIDPSQELIAIGATNILGSFFGAYPSTSSFSRTAIKSRSGVRTPLAGIFSSMLVVLSLYVLTPAFHYIPNAVLSAVVIHAVLGLTSSPSYVIELWLIQFWDFAVFAVGVIFTFFFTTEVGIAASVALSTIVLLVRLSHPKYEVLGRIELKHATDSNEDRYAFAPLHSRSFKEVMPPPAGVLIFRIDGSLTYQSAPYIDDKITDYVKSKTRRDFKLSANNGDQQWNECNLENHDFEIGNLRKPTLNAVVFDLVAMSHLDSTGLQTLINMKKDLNKYSGHEIEYHFANILSNTIKKSLIVGGFGVTTGKANGDYPNNSKNQKNFFHLTLYEAVTAATNGVWSYYF